MKQEYLDKIYSLVDYEVGDWVETCHVLPGIVESIDYDKGMVRVFYPHMALEYPGKYFGGSGCSILHCGVRKITPEHAKKLLAIGEERLKELCEGTYSTTDTWEEIVDREYNKIYKKCQLRKQ